MLAPWAPLTHAVRTMVADGRPPPGPRARRPACCARRPTADRAGPTRRTAGRACRRRRSRSRRRPGGRRRPWRLGDVAGAEGVDGEGGVGIGLAGVHRGVGPAVEHDVGPEGVDGRPDRRPVDHVQVSMSVREHVEGAAVPRTPPARIPRAGLGRRSAPRPASDVAQVPTELAVPAGEQDPQPVELTARGRVGRPRPLDDRGPVPKRLPPAPVVAAYQPRCRPGPGRRDGRLPAQLPSDLRRVEEVAPVVARSVGDDLLQARGLPVAVRTASAISSMLASTPLPTL